MPHIATNECYFSMFAGVPDDPIYQVISDTLRLISTFRNYQGFYEYHVQLIGLFLKANALLMNRLLHNMI